MITTKQINLIEELQNLLEIQNNNVKISLPAGDGEASVELKVCADGYLTFAGTDSAGIENIGFGYDDGDPYVTISGNDIYCDLPIRVNEVTDVEENNSISLSNGLGGIDITSPYQMYISGPGDYGLNIQSIEESSYTMLGGEHVVINADSGGSLELQYDTESQIRITSNGIIMPELPTSDPQVEGAL